MKPKTRNLVVCPDCGRRKMLFETEAKANNFIKYNGSDIDTHGGELRPYYCPACCGYHISSKPHKWSYDKQTEKLIETYKKDLEVLKAKRLAEDKTQKQSEFEHHVKAILDNLPPEFKTKTELKDFLTAYFKENDITTQQRQDYIRHYFNEMVASGELVLEGHKINKPTRKDMSDDEIFSMIPDTEKVNHNKFMEAVRLSIPRYGIKIDKEQRDRLQQMWYDYNYNMHNK